MIHKTALLLASAHYILFLDPFLPESLQFLLEFDGIQEEQQVRVLPLQLVLLSSSLFD
jgi:hypothetical protein